MTQPTVTVLVPGRPVMVSDKPAELRVGGVPVVGDE